MIRTGGSDSIAALWDPYHFVEGGELMVTETARLLELGITPLAGSSACRELLGVAAYSWWRPFPTAVYVYEELGQRNSVYALGTLAQSITELAGRTSEMGDRIIEHREGDAYIGPEPYLFSNIAPPGDDERVASEWHPYVHDIVDAMKNSQRPDLIPVAEKRIRMALATGSRPLPHDFAEDFLTIKVPAAVLEMDWLTISEARSARLELGQQIRSWILERRDSAFMDDLEGSAPSAREAAALGREILNRFLADEGLGPLTPPVAVSRITRTTPSLPRHRDTPAEPGLVTLMQDIVRDAIATGRACLGRGEAGQVVLGRVAGDRVHLLPSATRELVVSSGYTTASAMTFGRSLAAEGWINESPGRSWSVPRRVDGKVRRVWNLSVAFIGEMATAHDVAPAEGGDRADRIRRVIAGALSGGRAHLVGDAAAVTSLQLGARKDDRIYLIPGALRQLLGEEGEGDVSVRRVGAVLVDAGWLRVEDGQPTSVGRRIRGRLVRVWDLPAEFVDEVPADGWDGQRAL